MARKIIAVGSAGNDGTGDTLRAGAIKMNDNFEELYKDVANLGVLVSDSAGGLNLEGISFDQRSVVFIGVDSPNSSPSDTNETSLNATEPTKDNTITLPDSSGTVALLSDIASNPAVLDSAAILAFTSDLDSAKTITLIEQNSIDSTGVINLVDATYISNRVPSGLDSNLVQQEIDAYVTKGYLLQNNLVLDSGLVKDIIDSSENSIFEVNFDSAVQNVDQHFKPYADATFDLGDSVRSWKNLYIASEIKIGAAGSFATITESAGVIDLPSGTTLGGSAISTGGGGGGGGDSNVGNAILHDSEDNIYSYNTDNPDGGATNNVLIGNDAGVRLTTGDNNVFLGRNAGQHSTNGASTGYNQTVIGYGANGGGTTRDTVAIGRNASVQQNFNVGIGASCLAAGSGQNVAVGYSANAQGVDTIALGSSTTATANNSISLGPNNTNGSAGRLIIGSSNTTDLRCQVTTISSLSDKRDKVEINDLTIGLNFVNDVSPKYFRRNDRARYYTATYTEEQILDDPSLTQSWNFDSDAHVAAGQKNDKYEFGWIAQDVETALPSGYADSSRLTFLEDINDTRFSYDVQRFTAGDMLPILWKAVQELSTKYDNLDSDHTALKARVAALESN